ncbi:MAG: proprotein convertase P-domain-containing protein [Bacteroidia bacterium]
MHQFYSFLPRTVRTLVLATALTAGAAAQAQNFHAWGGTVPNNTINNFFSQNVTGVGALTGSNKLTRVCLSITQPVAGDIDVYLTSPAGTTVMLSTDNGGSSGNDYHTGICFSECGPSGSIIGANDFKGVYLPEQSIAAFNNGQNANGTWTLRVDDDAATGGAGTLNYWSLDFGSNTMPTSPNGRNCGSAYVLTSLPFQNPCMTLAGSGNDYTNGACNNHIDGSEYVYAYTPTTADEYLSIDIAQDFSAPSGFPTVSLLDTCPNFAQPVNCIATEIQFSSTENILHITSQPLTLGKHYYIVVSSTSGEGGVYDMRIAMGRNGSPNCLTATNINSTGEYAGNNYSAPGGNPQAPGTSEMTCNGSIDNFIFYTFTTDNSGATVHASLTDIACNLSCGGACGVQVALFQMPAGGPCLGPGSWGSPVFCGTSTLTNAYYSWSGLMPNTQYYLMVDGTAGSQCVWNLRLQGGISVQALPVSWGGVEVAYAEGRSHVTWSTMQEVNVDHFEVEHSMDFPYFERIGTVRAKGGPEQGGSYAFDQTDVAPGWHYYRIKNLDRNGDQSYSEVRKVFVEQDGDYYSLHPNPAHDLLNLRMVAEGPRHIRVLGVDGREWQELDWDASGVIENVPLNVAEMPAGVYWLEIGAPSGQVDVLRWVKI